MKNNSLRVMYHNVLGFNLDSTPVNDRADKMLAVYEQYTPDVICLEEFTLEFRNSPESASLTSWLEENYTELCFGDGTSNNGGTTTPIFYKNTLTLKKSGYAAAYEYYPSRANGNKGTTWAIFEKDGDVFCVSNSHFVANGEGKTAGNVTLSREYRVQDVNSWLTELSSEVLVGEYQNIPVISGGDFNGYYIDETDDGVSTAHYVLRSNSFADVRTLVDDAPTKAAIHTLGSDSLDKTNDQAIDHVLVKATADKLTVNAYANVDTPDALASSDHAPHYLDITLN